MIQLRTLRPNASPNAKTRDSDAPLDPNILPIDLRDMFENWEHYLSQVPAAQRYNLYYTLGESNGTYARRWFGQDVIPFDIDSVVDENGESDDERLIEIIFSVLKADADKSIVVHSGNGLQILIQPLHSIPEGGEDFFRKKLRAYAALYDEVIDAIHAAGLRAEKDISSFAPNRLFRYPGSENRKPDKPPRLARLLRGKLRPQEFQISPDAPGVKPKLEPWETDQKGQVNQRQLIYTKIDSGSVEEGCEFLKAAKAEPNDLDEPQWYAMLGIVGRLKDGEQKAQEYSMGHAAYNEAMTAKKLAQALEGSGPRTCKNINELWGNCHKCEFYGAVSSPIFIKNDSFIATEEKGFHGLNEKGGLVPKVEDLRKYMSRELHYKAHAKSGLVYVWTGAKYEIWSQTEIRGYAHEHFDPKPERSDTIEDFKRLVSNSNLVPSDWFLDTTMGYVNFRNGVFNLETKEFTEHSPRQGFLYCLPFDYDPSAKAPVFEKFMKDITCGDKELETVLIEFIGYSICDTEYEHHKSLLLLGEGANGKSTFIQIVQSLIGDENVSNLSFSDLHSETSRSVLQGKLLNTCEELSHKDIQDTEHFKQLFGGKTRGRRLYQDATEFQNTAKFIFAGNTLPVAADSSKGYARRLILAPFNADFEKSGGDKKIIKKMRMELSGIFNIVMRVYAAMLEREEFTESAASTRLLDAHKKELDPVGDWISEHLEFSSIDEAHGPFMEMAVVYEAYKTQAEKNGERLMSKILFTKKFQRHVPGWDSRHVRRVVGDRRPWVLLGTRMQLDAPSGKAEF